MDPLIDVQRVAELELIMKEPLGNLVSDLVRSMDESIERAHTALAASDLEAVAGAAHRCRNDALIVGAQPLETALAALEMSARGGAPADAAGCLVDVDHAWSRTRPELLNAGGAE